MAMRMGKHCFCQKPLTHTIYEARLMGEVAREKKLATQMGNQGTADSGSARGGRLAPGRRAGHGHAKCTSGRTGRSGRRGSRGRHRPSAPRTSTGTCGSARRPSGPTQRGYHPFDWRGWWDFGTGALGDMACHTINMAFMGLDLRDPISVQAETSGHNKDSFPSGRSSPSSSRPTTGGPGEADLVRRRQDARRANCATARSRATGNW